MKRYFLFVVTCIILGFLLPVTVFFIMRFPENKNILKKSHSSGEVKVYFHDENTVKTMGMEEYLFGVVAAEMPASFEKEALKAQAVAARSYTAYRSNNPTKEHPDANVCTDINHCKAYKTKERAMQGWGENAYLYAEKIQAAVNETSGQIVTYNGEVAMTVFHSQAGGGKTENSKDVWGGDVPYLVSVESHGEENAPNFYSSVSYEFQEFKRILSEKYENLILENPTDYEIMEISDGGMVKKMKIGNVELTGREVRSLYGLRSSCFKIISNSTDITFEVTGYGHGVGMSQYGANTMAKEGYNYIDILKHYYQGTEIDSV